MRFGMVIDLQRCVGCGACAFACKAENNTRTRGDGQSFNWADFVMKTEGTFPDVTHWVMPVLCNHCSNAPCVEVCPTEPKAMFKTPEGITLHDSEQCIGCRRCQQGVPCTAAASWARKPERRSPTASSASTPTASRSSRSGRTPPPSSRVAPRRRPMSPRPRARPSPRSTRSWKATRRASAPRAWSRSAPSATTAR